MKFNGRDMTAYATFTGGAADGGYEDGFAAGQQESYDRFWDMYQQNGNRTDYRQAMRRWTDAWYNPKYPIVFGSENIYTAESALSESTIIDTKVPISIIGTRADATFQYCEELKTIRLLRCEDVIRFSNTFRYCYALTDITIEGAIGAAISFADSDLLTATSVQSIIDHLADLTGATAQTLTFHATVGGKLTDAQKATITAKNWTLVY